MLNIFLLFTIYSFFGWLMEVIFKFVQLRRFVNRGFLIGPFCPIYGVGGVGIHLVLSRFSNSIVLVFFLGMFLCAILEYFASWLLEKIFNARWWDYSQKKFNLNGRICLRNLLFFGILGCLGVYYINPFLFSIFDKIPIKTINKLSIIVLIIFILDVVISVTSMFNLKETFHDLRRDATEDISKRVKNLLLKNSSYFRRIIKAYPNFHFSGINFQNVKEKITKYSKKLKK